MARAFYSFITDAEVTEVGLVKHPTIAWTHASPDGEIGARGLIELALRHRAGQAPLGAGSPQILQGDRSASIPGVI
jgi:hypothetical protein